MRISDWSSDVCSSDLDLYIVADGMGGHQGGEVASRLAIETIQVAYDAPSADALSEALAVANQRIHNQAAADPNLHGMGTTVVAAALMSADGVDADDDEDHPQLLIANVGDSRAYLYRDGDLIQLTDEHSLVAHMVPEARSSPAGSEEHT